MICLPAILANEPPCAHTSWLSPNQIASIYGLAPNSVRALCDKALLPTTKLPSGWRKVRAEDAKAYFDKLIVKQEEKPSSEDGGEVLIYARVSGQKQGKGHLKGNTDSDLMRQVERLVAKAKELGCSNPVIFKECGSGMSESRPQYNKLIDELLAGKHKGKTLLIEHRDRLSRFSQQLFLKVAKHGGVTVIFTEVKPTLAQEEELVQDVLNLIQSFGSKVYSQRSAKRRTVVLDSTQLAKVYELHSQGYSTRDIETRFKNAVSSNGKPLSRKVLRRILGNANKEVVKELVGAPTIRNSYQRWELAHIKATSKPTTISKKKLYELYLEWCSNNNETPITAANLGAYYRRKGTEAKYNRQGQLIYVGLSLKTKGN